jgi:hypothetical protein
MKPFKDRFKPGDIIRRGGFIREGQLMIVESYEECEECDNRFFNFEPAYSCQDMFVSGQKWAASEGGEFTLATDEDIISELARRVETEEDFDDSFGNITVEANDEHLTLSQNDMILFLDPITALELQDFINDYVREL